MIYLYKFHFIFHFVSISHYYPSVNQCDSSPNVTADGSKIDTVALRQGRIKWCALSRDLIYCEHRQRLTNDKTIWRGQYRFGDTISILWLGEYVVHDVMNQRFRNKIDVLSYERTGYTQTAILR